MPMATLRLCLEQQGFANVTTYIQSGNVVLQSDLSAKALAQKVETALPITFNVGSSPIKALALTRNQLQAVIDNKPKGFGEQPEKYYSDVIFLIDIGVTQALPIFDPRDGIDKIWPGDKVIYSQRLSAKRTQSRLSKIVSTPAYKSMTIRNWNTTTKLLEMIDKVDTSEH